MMAINHERVEPDIPTVVQRIKTVVEDIETVVGDIRTVVGDIQRVEENIQRVEQEIEDVESRLEAAAREGVASSREKQRRLGKKERRLKKKERRLGKEKKQLQERVTQLRDKEKQLREKKLLLTQQQFREESIRADTSDAVVDRSGNWIKHMLREQPPELPQNPIDLEKILFPEKHGKLPVNQLTYRRFQIMQPQQTEEFLIQADVSEVPTHLSEVLLGIVGPVVSEMDVSIYLGYQLPRLFGLFNRYRLTKFLHGFQFNKSERKGGGLSGSTEIRTGPDTLLIAKNTTLLVGEDKLDSLPAAERDLSNKVMELSTMFYGLVQFLLGYIAAGREFQWVYLGKDGKELKRINPCLDLQDFSDRCRFLLSLGHAYQLLHRMATLVPDVPGGHAMFSTDLLGDRELFFLPGSVVKKIRNFGGFCALCRTDLSVIKKAYLAAKGCKFLPNVVEEPTVSREGTYSVKIRPLGCSVMVRSEQDCKMLAQHVCKALSVLHKARLVHRDVRLPNIVMVEKHFMLIDLETVAKSPFILPEGFEYFANWREEMLVGNWYTPASDMYQLGRVLEGFPYMITGGAKDFIKGLTSKQLSSTLALQDPWLSNPTP